MSSCPQMYTDERHSIRSVYNMFIGIQKFFGQCLAYAGKYDEKEKDKVFKPNNKRKIRAADMHFSQDPELVSYLTRHMRMRM